MFKQKMASVAVFLMAFMATIPFASAQESKEYKCIPTINIVIDLGYCFGFSMSYYEAIDDQGTIEKIKSGDVEQNIKIAHDQCYPTDFDGQKQLGHLGFSSYINLADDSLLRQSADHCNVLMGYYAKQNSKE